MEETLYVAKSDKDLWQNFKNGNELAFSKIYRKNIQALFSYGYKLTSDENLVEDSIHDLFIELWKRRIFLSDVTCIKLYLLKGLDRKIKRKMIQHRKKIAMNYMVSNNCEMPFEFRWINEQSAAENSLKLQQAMDTLSVRQREVLTMHFFEGRNYTEIAKVINIKYQSVANLMCQTLRKLRKGMKFNTNPN